ncbi:hypothetical protein NDU88_000641 [Pleurodeles waltl]|uniref:Uncharacterized protein n=1 Tax=Pleurodeles waltl TaxID=8319 RepID=A0AAV7TFJ0_PLEWA|nr:hypothetical protein NDU88_000641 [Pleurodeles waltl]
MAPTRCHRCRQPSHTGPSSAAKAAAAGTGVKHEPCPNRGHAPHEAAVWPDPRCGLRGRADAHPLLSAAAPEPGPPPLRPTRRTSEALGQRDPRGHRRLPKEGPREAPEESGRPSSVKEHRGKPQPSSAEKTACYLRGVNRRAPHSK